MNKILHTTIICLLIPSFVFAQVPQYRGNEPSIKPTDLSRVWNALNTEVGQQIVSYIETTVGSIDLDQAKAFNTANGEVFVPIKSFSKMLAALCYRQLEDGSEYLFFITYNAKEKGVSFTFPSGQMYVMKSSGVTESANPDFQFQENNDVSNKVSMNANEIISLLCSPLAFHGAPQNERDFLVGIRAFGRHSRFSFFLIRPAHPATHPMAWTPARRPCVP